MIPIVIYYIFLGTGILCITWLFVNSIRQLYFKERITLLEYMLILHLSAIAGIYVYLSLRLYVAFAGAFIFSIVCSIIGFAGAVWGRSQAVQNHSFSKYLGIVIGFLIPFVWVGVMPVSIGLIHQSMWLDLVIAAVIFIIFLFAQNKLLRPARRVLRK